MYGHEAGSAVNQCSETRMLLMQQTELITFELQEQQVE